MKKAYTTLVLSIFTLIFAQSQPFYTTLGNNNHLTFAANGNIWADGVSSIFKDKPNTIFSGGIWLGGIGRNSNEFKAAIHTYLTSGNDYIAGPCDPSISESTRSQIANQFNKIWKVTATDIAAHILDMKDGKLDFPISSIMAWPAKGNPFFKQYNFFENPYYSRDLAPFKDTDQDGIYNPSKGDYPIIYQAAIEHQPDEIFWSVFNDINFHPSSKANPLNFEIQQTGWNYNCTNDALLSNINFLSYKIINYSDEVIDSLFMGYWTDPDIGCYQDDGIGSVPSENAFFAYNYDNIDGDANNVCPGGLSLFKDNEIPAYSIKFLNEKMFSFMNLLVNKSSTFYKIMNGIWDDDLPMTRGGDGYNPNSADITKFAFDGNPNDSNEWSMRSAQLGGRDVRGIGNLYLEKLEPSQSKTVDMAFTLHYDDNLGSINSQIAKMYLDFSKIQNYYDKAFKEETCVRNECTAGVRCVYPGDTNNDGIVNTEDCLSVFVNNGKKGNARDGSLLWAPKNAKNWNDVDINGLNNKYSDCDGNGEIVFERDRYIISEHFGKSHSNYVAKPDKYLQGTSIFVKKSSQFDSLNISKLGGSLLLEVAHKFLDTTAWAFCYDIEFDGNILNLSSVATNTFEFSKKTPNEFHYASNNNRTNLLKLTFLPEIIDVGRVPYSCTQLKFKNIKVVRKDGSEVINIGARDVQLCFNKQLVSNPELNPATFNATCYPNPITNNTIIENKTDEVLAFELYDMNGRLLTNGIVNMQSIYNLDCSAYLSGVYLLMLKDKQQNQKQIKLIKI